MTQEAKYEYADDWQYEVYLTPKEFLAMEGITTLNADLVREQARQIRAHQARASARNLVIQDRHHYPLPLTITGLPSPSIDPWGDHVPALSDSEAERHDGGGLEPRDLPPAGWSLLGEDTRAHLTGFVECLLKSCPRTDRPAERHRKLASIAPLCLKALCQGEVPHVGRDARPFVASWVFTKARDREPWERTWSGLLMRIPPRELHEFVRTLIVALDRPGYSSALKAKLEAVRTARAAPRTDPQDGIVASMRAQVRRAVDAAKKARETWS